MINYTRKEKYINLKDNKDYDFNELRKKIISDQNYPNFHITAPTGLINDPNALYFDKEYHNINFQWFPFFGHHGLKHWGNVKTKDFVNFESNFDDIVYPSTKFDNGGISFKFVINNITSVESMYFSIWVFNSSTWVNT